MIWPFAAQFIERAGLATFGEFEFDAEHCEHRQEFAGTKFRRATTLEARQGFGGYASLMRDRFLPQAEGLAAGRHCGSQFLECLHIDIYIMILANIAIY